MKSLGNRPKEWMLWRFRIPKKLWCGRGSNLYWESIRNIGSIRGSDIYLELKYNLLESHYTFYYIMNLSAFPALYRVAFEGLQALCCAGFEEPRIVSGPAPDHEGCGIVGNKNGWLRCSGSP